LKFIFKNTYAAVTEVQLLMMMFMLMIVCL